MYYNRKSLIAIIITATLTMSLVSCGSSTDTSVGDTEVPEEERVYTIGLLGDSESRELSYMKQGFCDALSDGLGEECITYVDSASYGNYTPEDRLITIIHNNPDLIFALGEEALSSSSIRTKTIPIVGAGVIDYAYALHISEGEWSGKSGSNVTGTTSRPPIAAELSLLLENDVDVSAVGIFYTPDEHDSIYQNEILEGYLDEAGIPWKEFAVTDETVYNAEEPPSDTDTLSDEIITGEDDEDAGSGEDEDVEESAASGDSTVEDNSEIIYDEIDERAIFPGAFYASSSREGMSLYADPIGKMGDDMLLNSIKSLRTPGQSDLWTEDTLISSCFIPAGSSLSKDPAFTEYIRGLWQEDGVITVSGDSLMAENTMFSIYTDPYDLGYSAGKMACRILTEGADPGTIKITGTSEKDAIKLYNGRMAALSALTFPKSYYEYYEFMDTYIPGENTERISVSEEEE